MREAPEQVIGRALVPGENLLWSGAPRAGIVFRRTDVLAMPLNLAVCGFAAFWVFAAVSSREVFFMVAGIPFVIASLYTAVGRFFVAAWLRSNTYYAVTDRRVIIALVVFGLNVESFDLDRIDTMTISERPDGDGTITFVARPTQTWILSARRVSVTSRPTLPSFERIENVSVVFDIIQRAKQGAHAAAGAAR